VKAPEKAEDDDLLVSRLTRDRIRSSGWGSHLLANGAGARYYEG